MNEESCCEHALRNVAYDITLKEEDDGRRAAYTIPPSGALNILLLPPLNSLQIRIQLEVRKLTSIHFRPCCSILPPSWFVAIKSGKLPIHIASRTNTPIQVLALPLELDPAQLLHRDDQIGALPLLEC